MREYLVFDLSAPMGAFGSYAGHERRGSEIMPPRSAVLGLLGAALGIERSDHDGQAALRRYRVAVRLLAQSAPLRDYHTVQTVPAKIRAAQRPPCRDRSHRTRRQDVHHGARLPHGRRLCRRGVER